MLQNHKRFFILLALFIVTILVYQAGLPVLEGNDETHHYNYINWLRTHNTLPDRADPIGSGVMQEGGQPPLTYWITAVVLNILNTPTHTGDVMRLVADVRNPWSPVAERWRPTDNISLFYHGDYEEAFGHPDIVSSVRAGRLVSLAFLIVALIAAYGAACQVFDREKWALAAAVLFGFVPLFLYTGAYISNEVGGIAFATLAIWQTLYLLRHGASPRRLLLIGALIGLAALSKVSTLLITPGIGLALLFDWRQRHLSITQFIINGLLVGLPAALLFSPWVLYGLTTYNDPFGFGAYTILKATIPPNTPTPTVLDILSTLPEMYLAYWARLGHAQVWMSPTVYLLITVIIILSLVGYLAQVMSRRPMSRLFVQQMLVLLVIAFLLLVGLIRWLVDLWGLRSTFTGRLMYPAHAAFAILIVGGLYLLACRLSRPLATLLRLYTVSALIAICLFAAPLLIRAMFGPPPRLTAQQLPALHGGPVDFGDTIRFLGYAQDDPRIYQGVLSGMTVCWEVLRPASRPAAYAMKYFDDKGHAVGERTTIFGTGRYASTLWKPGDVFCEDVDIPVFDPLEPARTYNVILTVLDARTQASDWKPTMPDGRAIPIAAVGQVASPARDMTVTRRVDWQQAAITFPDFVDLKGFALDKEPQPGTSITLSVLWDVRKPRRDDLSFFVHLVGPDTMVVLADGTPRGGRYPTWVWSVGEQIVDQWTLTIPPDLPAGQYAIKIGFYHKDGGERLDVSQNGSVLGDRIATLLTFQVKK